MSDATAPVVDPRIAAAQEVLAHAQCGDTFYRHWAGRLQYSQAVKYLAEVAECYWLIDVIASHQPAVRKKIAIAQDRDFQVWTLTLRPSGGATVICDNGNGLRYKRQEIEYTDFPLSTVKLYVVDGRLILPGEY